MRVDISSAEIAEPERVTLAYEQMLRNLEAIPGVSLVRGSSRVTMEGGSNAPLGVEGFWAAEGQFPPTRRYKWALPDHFETMQNEVLAGRSITWADIHARAPVTMITENLALEYWGSAAEAIGKRLRDEAPTESDHAPPWREVIGVVGNVRDDGIAEDPVPTVYWPVINRQFWGDDSDRTRDDDVRHLHATDTHRGRHTLVLAGVGAAAGVAMAIGLTRWISALLYGVSPVDPLTFAAVTVAVAATALLASYLPARRAACMNPVTALPPLCSRVAATLTLDGYGGHRRDRTYTDRADVCRLCPGGGSMSDTAERDQLDEVFTRQEAEAQEGGVALMFMCRHTAGVPEPQDS